MVPAAVPDWSGRLRQLQQELLAGTLDAVVVSTPANIGYLTGFTGTAGLLVVTRDRPSLLVDGRYDAAARDAMARGALATLEIAPVPAGYAEALTALLDRLAAVRIGFEAGHVTVATLDDWRAKFSGRDWVRTDRLVEDLRIRKDAVELACLRRGARQLSEVAGRLGEFVKAGAREIDVARAIDRALEAAGFSGPAFTTIVASGPNSALPHARPTSRQLRSGDLVLLDFGGVLDGYCTDLTRMAAISRLGEDAHRLFRAVFDAEAAAIDAVRPGVSAASVDGAARQVLVDRGYGAAFLHATGHGLGLEVHEAPRLGRAVGDEASEVLAEGMVFTVEPGAYVAGLGGVRIEDDVLVTATGVEVLTTASRDLLIV
ncbi:MAG TPA: Xaa-Pro peptidase family protein [Vicinamibacterales bacterium]|nr:Xaa-Pro peptidase family protein [Vicinamibacterales bacterium]